MTAVMPDMDGSQNCASSDPEAFFPISKRQERHAAALCHGCPYREPCRDYALTNNVLGVWGGTTYEQRRQIRRNTGMIARPVTGELLTRTRPAVTKRKSRARLQQ